MIEWRFARLDELSAREVHDILQARAAVFVVEQACVFQDVDGADPDSWHLFARMDGALAAYCRIIPAGVKFAEPSIGRVITTETVRGTGLGRAVMQEALRRAAALWPGTAIRIGAQQRLEAFYRSLGFVTDSQPYDEDGIPHVQMIRTGGNRMTLKIYGIAASRTIRNLWMAEELGLAYEHVPIHYRDDPDGPLGKNNSAFRRANPMGRVPAIDDGGFTLSESMAINLYLARKHGKGLWPATVEGEGLAFQWSFFAVTEVDLPMNEWASNSFVLPEDKRDPAKAASALEKLQVPLAVVDSALAKTPYLTGDAFTVADLNLSAVMFRARRMNHATRPHLARWLQDCFARPAARRTWAMRGE